METKLDPRIIRSRKAIIDAFISLSEAKPFESITVKDITDKALINRATFYNHFLDKYDLMEKALLEDVQINLNRQTYRNMSLDNDYVSEIFEALCSFNTHLEKQCQRSYILTINQLVMDQLEVIHTQKLSEKYPDLDEPTIHKMAKFFSAGMFALSQDWYNHSSEESPSGYLQGSLVFIESLLNTTF